MATRLRRLHDDESGSVLLLILGFGVVVLALALVVASISALHIDSRAYHESHTRRAFQNQREMAEYLEDLLSRKEAAV